MRKLLLPAAVLLLVPACVYDTPPPEEPNTSGQSYAEALGIMCDVDKLAQIPTDEDPLSVGRQRTEFIQAHVVNPDGIYLRTMLSVKGAAEQATALREEAKEAGVARCALADTMEKDGSGGISP